MARPSLSTEELAARGSWRAAHRRKHSAESRVRAGRPNPPADIAAHPELLATWNHLCDALQQAGVLAPTDVKALARYCHLDFRYQRATNWVIKNGSTVVTPTGIERVAPEATEAEACASQLLKLDKEFGLTPGARRTIKASPASPSGSDGQDGEPTDEEVLGIVG